MTAQTIVVALAIAASVGFALNWVRKALQSETDPCAGCDGCALKGAKEAKKRCGKKKVGEKFGGL